MVIRVLYTHTNIHIRIAEYNLHQFSIVSKITF